MDSGMNETMLKALTEEGVLIILNCSAKIGLGKFMFDEKQG